MAHMPMLFTTFGNGLRSSRGREYVVMRLDLGVARVMNRFGRMLSAGMFDHVASV